jgi:hypothetical protein
LRAGALPKVCSQRKIFCPPTKNRNFALAAIDRVIQYASADSICFQLAISAEHFTNEPEGGFAVVGDIKYTAEVAKTCGVLDNNVDALDLEQPVPVNGR